MAKASPTLGQPGRGSRSGAVSGIGSINRGKIRAGDAPVGHGPSPGGRVSGAPRANTKVVSQGKVPSNPAS